MKLISVVGARPQFIKVAQISAAIKEFNRKESMEVIKDILVHTGQHYDFDMSGIFFKDLEIKEPDYHLAVGSGSHGYQTAEILKKLEQILIKERPDIVMVYGDTNSTLAGALAASKLHIRVGHVEAGLRSFNKNMPEEINRLLTDHISDILFCPTNTAVKNLYNEGIKKGIYNVGDVMQDSLILNSQIAEQRSCILQNLNLINDFIIEDYALATVHRQENTDDPNRLRSIFDALNNIATKQMKVILPLHPRTKKYLENSFLYDHITIISPISYIDMLVLEKNAKIILTDSGGVQKEAYFFRIPCITLREETEWNETIEDGLNILTGADIEKIICSAKNISNFKKGNSSLCLSKSSEKILKVLIELEISRQISEKKSCKNDT